MSKKIIILIASIIIITTAVYFTLIYSLQNTSNYEEEKYLKEESAYELKVDLESSVSVLIQRTRWYGKIIEQDGESRLYLFYFLPIPLHERQINFKWIHISFLGISAYLITLLIFAIVYKDKKTSNTDEINI